MRVSTNVAAKKRVTEKIIGSDVQNHLNIYFKTEQKHTVKESHEV